MDNSSPIVMLHMHVGCDNLAWCGGHATYFLPLLLGYTAVYLLGAVAALDLVCPNNA